SCSKASRQTPATCLAVAVSGHAARVRKPGALPKSRNCARWMMVARWHATSPDELRHAHPANVLRVADRTKAHVLHVGGEGAVPPGVVDEEACRIVYEDPRRLLIQGLPLFLFGHCQGLVGEFIEFWVLVETGIAGADGVTVVNGAGPVVRVCEV